MTIYIKQIFAWLLLMFGCCDALLGQQSLTGAVIIQDSTADIQDGAVKVTGSIVVPVVDSEKASPFLTGYYYASSKKDLLGFSAIAKELSRRKSVEYDGNSGTQPASFAFPRFPSNIRLALFFRNLPWHGQIHEAAPLEYKFFDAAEKNGDTSIPWSTTSDHFIIIPQLTAGVHYMLMVRYKGEGNAVSAYFFHTQTFWTPYFRLFKRNILYFLFIFLLINIFLLWRYVNTKRRNRQYQLELKSLFAQLNPHFVFNSLSSIQGLINTNEIEKANQYLSGFSGLLRTTLDKGGKDLIPLSEDLDNLDNYIHFEQLRFNFRYEQDIEPELSLDDLSMLPLLAQPLIENSVKHGISGMGDNGLLSIRLYTVQRDLFISIKDNGKGFDVEEYKAGYGMDLVQKRIAAYNKWHHKTKIILTMKSAPGNTILVLMFQNWLPK